jgi:hypothetical protein
VVVDNHPSIVDSTQQIRGPTGAANALAVDDPGPSGQIARTASACPAAGQRDPVGESKLKKDLASGKIELAQVVAQPPECVRTARVDDVLLALPKIGAVKAGRILADCGIAHSKTLGALTERQRTELLSRFGRGGRDK